MVDGLMRETHLLVGSAPCLLSRAIGGAIEGVGTRLISSMGGGG